MRREQRESQKKEVVTGAFVTDGAWVENAGLGARGQVHAFVVALCRSRREGRLTPEAASRAIEAANGTRSFPNWKQWARCLDWTLCWTSTAAEEAVKREGNGACGGHWCGQRWVPISEKDCHEPGHRVVMDKERLGRLIDAAFPARP